MPGWHTKTLFDEVRNLVERIPIQIEFEKDYGNPDNIPHWEKVLSICRDLEDNGVSSRFFKWQKTHKVLRKPFSQIRPITIKPKLVGKIRDTLKSGTPIRNPIWTIDDESHPLHDCTLLNGGNRCTAVDEEIKAGSLPEDHHVGTIHIPREYAIILKPIVSSIQAILNDHLPSEGNDKNCVQKHLKEKVSEWGWIDKAFTDEMNEKLLKYALVTFSCSMSPKGIKGNVTRLQNKLREQYGHVLTANPEDFISRFVDFMNYQNSLKAKTEGCTSSVIGFAKPKSYVTETVNIPHLGLFNTSLNFVSTKGSVIDQLLKRQMTNSYDGKCNATVEIFAAQDHGGEMETVLKSRITYLEDKYKLWTIAQKHGGYRDNLVPDYYAISPQLQGGTNTSLFGKKVNVSPEETELVISDNSYEKKLPDYIIISRKELIECFKTGKAYRKEWIAKIEVQKK